ncbi:Polyprotein [Phytophthora palmivora]|uniref:Polyprotein n=1 Tax=Phytophthora palmivora TaxID=4796 RepID=A0A2P4Y7N5_9STRA|nr:Polyprotein [Phytophthora palmivora]
MIGLGNRGLKGFSHVVSKYPPSQLSPDQGVRHEIVFEPGTKYCVTRPWPLSREQCEVIDALFAEKGNVSMAGIENPTLDAHPLAFVNQTGSGVSSTFTIT